MVGPPPLSTYRLQLQPGFGFDEAAAVVPYLDRLGVTHVYLSPCLQAVRGSTHGYDVVDPTRASADLGGEPARLRLVEAVQAVGMGLVVDIVPNHVSVAEPQQNAWWWDVLRHGRASRYAGFFDIDWDVPWAGDPARRGRLLVPILGDDDADLRGGHLQLVREDGEVLLGWHDHRFPVAAGSLGTELEARLAAGEDTAWAEVQQLDPVAVHDRQHYALAYWRLGGDQLNYRRFFDVSTLAAVRLEDDGVFDAVHGKVLRWVGAGEVDGLRVDHPDGLADPEGYVRRLAARAPGAWRVIEKIVEPGEQLPADWPVAGTTGYDAMRLLTGLHVDPAGEAALTRLWVESSGDSRSFGEVVVETKLRAATTVLAAETSRLVVDWGRALPLGETVPERAFDVVAVLLASFPVYRSYLRPGRNDAEQRAVLDAAVEEAQRRAPELADGLSALGALLGSPGPGTPAALQTRFQQTSGMVMAKGVEDTAFYRYSRLVALNEVGGDPAAFGVDVGEWHAFCERQAREWPLSMTALSTHDTKRSEGVRARVALLSEDPSSWRSAVEGFGAAAARFWPADLERDGGTEQLLWQTLVGAWPLPADRAVAYLEKATREAKQRTSWTEPDTDYDTALAGLVRGLLGDQPFLDQLEAVARPLVEPGRTVELAQKVLQLTMPGVPDTYQGQELEDLTLVDPDNRRPVDFGRREALLAAVDAGLTAEQVLARGDEGPPLLLVTSRLLRLRRSRPEWFGPTGGYVALSAAGSMADHVVTFGRGTSDGSPPQSITVVPRLVLGLERSGGWGDTALELPAGRWSSAFGGSAVDGGRAVPLAELLSAFPVEVLTRG